MFRRDRWWIREIERINRAHAAERAELISTISRLAGKPERTTTVAKPDPEPVSWTPSPEQLPVN